MRFLLSLGLILGLFFGCSQPSQRQYATVSGKITFLDDAQPDSFYVGLYPMKEIDEKSNSNYLAAPLQSLKVVDSSFSISVKPGKYTLVVFSLLSEKYYQHFLIPDHKTSLTLDIQLPRQGIDQEISNVLIASDYWGWTTEKPAMIKQGNVWVFPDTGLFKDGQKYNLIVNGNYIFNPTSRKNAVLGWNWAGFDNVYHGGPIIFDPKNYNQPRKFAAGKLSGFELNPQFVELAAELKELKNSIRQYRRKLWTNDPQKKPIAIYDSIEQKLNDLAGGYDGMFQQLILETRIINHTLTHPVHAEFRQTDTKEEVDSLKYKEVLNGSKFEDYFSQYLKLLGKLDPGSLLLEGHFVDRFPSFEFYIEKKSELASKFMLSENYFYNFAVDFVKKSNNQQVAAYILNYLGNRYAINEKTDQAKYLLEWLKKDFPNYSSVKGGAVDKALAGLKLQKGVKAPEFSVKTLTGDSLKLSDFKGKFVFIDFWGSWCGPCRRELPNLIKLSNSISAQQLQVIGLANDQLPKLTAFLKKNPLPYPNALASKELLKAYGIMKYPTTMLIDPQGKILVKELRGNKVVDKVKKIMATYQASKKSV